MVILKNLAEQTPESLHRSISTVWTLVNYWNKLIKTQLIQVRTIIKWKKMLLKKIDSSYKVKIQDTCPNICNNNYKLRKTKKSGKKCIKFRFNISLISRILFINIWRGMKYKNFQIIELWSKKYKLKIA